MTRIALETADDKLPFTQCSGGPDDPAPSCSQPLRLESALAGFEREAVPGELDAGRYRMRYRVWGRGPALIFIHGLSPITPASFVLPMSRLAEKFCCISYELPCGVGDGASLGSYRHEHLADDLFALCDHLHLETAVPIGVSFGSTIAIRALARDPARFPTGIIQGGFARRPLAWTEVLLARFARYWPGSIRRLPLHDVVLEETTRRRVRVGRARPLALLPRPAGKNTDGSRRSAGPMDRRDGPALDARDDPPAGAPHMRRT